MHVSRRTHSLLRTLIGGSVPFLLALSLRGQPAPYPPVSIPDAPHQVADALDKIVQPRFQDMTGGRFGASRLVPIIPGHSSVGFYGNFQADTPVETDLLASADAPHLPYLIALFHCTHVPGKPAGQLSSVSGLLDPFPYQSGSYNPTFAVRTKPYLATLVYKTFASRTVRYAPEMLDSVPREIVPEGRATEVLAQKAAKDALPALMKGKAEEKSAEGWLVVMRPVTASTLSCLSCHSGARVGDTLGVMVYAVRRTAEGK